MSRRGRLPALVAQLGRRELAIDDWAARASDRRVVWRRRDGDGVRDGVVELGRYQALVHRDVPTGRGSAWLDVEAGADAVLADAVADAAARALATIGPAWRSPPPAAPARVILADPAITTPGADALAPALDDTIAATAAGAGAELRSVTLTIVDEKVALATRRGLDAGWPQTEVAVELELVADGLVVPLARRARRLVELDLDRAIPAALARAARARAAAPTPPGRYPVVLEAEALLHGGHGLLAAFVAQADPALERQGLGAARLGRPIVAGADTTAEPLTLHSDGALDGGLASAPLTDAGDPVRRFAVVERGLIRGLALDAREAALRGAQANGGVRGLVVPPGSVDGDALVGGGGPVLVVEAVRWLELEPLTDRFRARIALARLYTGGGVRDVRDGLLHGHALPALALARRSRQTVRTPWYDGPARWAIGPLTVTGG